MAAVVTRKMLHEYTSPARYKYMTPAEADLTPLTLRCFQEFNLEGLAGDYVTNFQNDAWPEGMKEWYRGPDLAEAEAEYNHVEAHYKERETNREAQFKPRV